ncbi:MAG: hypothetical protein ACUVXJ_10560 [Phycisphaerae bacterium]
MERRSSIFSFETLTGLPRVTASLVLTLVLCAAFRVLLYAASDRLDRIPAPAIFQRYIELEDQVISRAKIRPKIVLMGNSMARYGLLEDQIAAAAGLAPAEVANLSVEAGQPWDALFFWRRNSEFFRDVQLVVYNVGFSELQERSVQRRLGHFYRFSTLPEKLTVDRWSDRVLMVLDWVWPFHSDRRDLVTWGLGFCGQSDYVQPEPMRPAWEPSKMARLQGRWLPRIAGTDPAFMPVVSVDRESTPAQWPEGTSQCQVGLLQQLVDQWRQAGIKVLLLAMPGATVIHRSRFGNQIAQTRLAQFEAAMSAMAGGDVAYLCWRDGAEAGLDDAADFMDECHLTPQGACKFTALIVSKLTAMHWLPPQPPESSLASTTVRYGPANP